MAEITDAPTEQPPTTQQLEALSTPSDIPQEFQGKSQRELADMVAEQRKYSGRQASEIGELRKQVAALQEQANAPTEEQIQEAFYENPKAVVDHLVNEKVRPLEQVVAEAHFHQELTQARPDWREVVANEGFQQWVSSSTYNQRLFQEADTNMDKSAALALLDGWDQSKKGPESGVVQEQDRQRRAAVTESGGSGPPGRTVLTRAAVRALKQHNPQEYEARLPEITQMYRDGLIK